MPREPGHLHAEGHLEHFRLRQSLRNGLLHGAVPLLRLIDLFERGIEVDADEALALQRVAVPAIPRAPEAVAGVQFEGAVVDFLGKRHGGLDDNVR